MRFALPVLLCVAMAATGCARVKESRLNPLNWFGGSRAEATTPSGELRPLVKAGDVIQVVDTRPLIATITSMRVDRTPGGAIVVATGTAASQDYFNAELVLVGLENGVMTLAFRAEAPSTFAPNGPARSREITAAKSFGSKELEGVRTIRVQAAQNARSASR